MTVDPKSMFYLPSRVQPITGIQRAHVAPLQGATYKGPRVHFIPPPSGVQPLTEGPESTCFPLGGATYDGGRTCLTPAEGQLVGAQPMTGGPESAFDRPSGVQPMGCNL